MSAAIPQRGETELRNPGLEMGPFYGQRWRTQSAATGATMGSLMATRSQRTIALSVAAAVCKSKRCGFHCRRLAGR